jgi:hypothetical protein
MKIKLKVPCGGNSVGSIHDVVSIIPHGGYSDSAKQYVLSDGTRVLCDNAEIVTTSSEPLGPLALYVWTQFSPDYSGGLAVALAHNESLARDQIETAMGYNPSDWGDLEVHPLDKPMAAAVSGGG